MTATLSSGEREEGARARGERWIYVRDIVKLVIMLHEPTSFLIAGNCGTGLRDLTDELAEQATWRVGGGESGLMAANENWTAMSTRAESRP